MTGSSIEGIILSTAQDTRAFGVRFARLLQPGDLLVLTGPLGAGKTVLVQGIGAGLGVSGAVVSPTFVISRIHRGGRIPLVHVDAYRLSSLAELDDLDLDVDIADSVTAVEWGAGLAERLTDHHLRIELGRRGGLDPGDDTDVDTDVRTGVDTDVRTVTLHPSDDEWRRRIGGLDPSDET